MLNIGKLGAGAAEYYLEHVARGVEDYYLHTGEAPGMWMGEGAASLGVAGEVGDQPLIDLLAGKNPLTGEGLALARPGHDRIPGFDLTFRAPKSVSLLFALGEGDVSREVKVGHEMAVRAALGYLEREAGFTRRRIGGAIVSVRADGFVAVAFQHRTSRAGDPLLHHHVLVANIVRDVSGRWGALDGRLVYAHAKTAGYLYQAELRAQLTRRLGARWTAVTRGTADIRGFSREVLRAFSRRRSEVITRMKERGEFSAKAAQAATLDTRRAKDYAVNPEGLLPEWRRRAAALGLTEERLAAMVDPSYVHLHVSKNAVVETLSALLAPTGLTAHASTFSRRDAVRAICELRPEADAMTVERVADTLLTTTDVVPLGAVEHAGTGRTRPDVPDQRRFTTRELLAIEHDLVERASQRNVRAQHLLHDAEARRLSLRLNPGYAGGSAPVPSGRVAAALRSRPSLSPEQRAMVERITSGKDAVVVVRGHAGTGKTVALDACRQAWERSGYRVVGSALAAQAAAELQAGAGITSTTIDRLLLELAGGAQLLPYASSVLVVDEAGMVGTRLLARLLERARSAEAKVVLAGDDHQLPEIDAGGAFRGLCERLGAVELTVNQRQREEWERQALRLLREGCPDEALRAYLEHGRVVVGTSSDAVRSQLVADWWAAEGREPGSTVMVALRRADVRELNERARALRMAAGAVCGPEVELPTGSFAGGDRVVTTRNARRLGVVNGSRGTLVEVDLQQRTVLVRLDARRGDTSARSVVLPAEYLEAGHLSHAYAITGHKAQGMTTSRAYVLGDDELYREWGYVALSRGREENRLYVVASGTEQVDDPHHERASAPPLSAAIWGVTEALRETRKQRMAIDHAGGSEQRPAATLQSVAARLDDAQLRAEARAATRATREAPPQPATRVSDRGAAVATLEERLAEAEARRGRLIEEVLRYQAELATTSGFIGRRRHRQERVWRTADIARARKEIEDIDTSRLPSIAAELRFLRKDIARQQAWQQRRGDAAMWGDVVHREMSERVHRRVAAAEAAPSPLHGDPPMSLAARDTWRARAHASETAYLTSGVARPAGTRPAVSGEVAPALGDAGQRRADHADVSATVRSTEIAEAEERERHRATRERLKRRRHDQAVEPHRPDRPSHDAHVVPHRDGPFMSP